MSLRKSVTETPPPSPLKRPAAAPSGPSFFQKYIAPNVFNFYPVASAIGLFYFAYHNGFKYQATMKNGGDWVIFLFCVKLCMIHNGLAHLFMTKIIHKSQGLTETPGSLMFENELGAVCLSLGIVAILAGKGAAVAAIAKAIGGFFFYAAGRHVYNWYRAWPGSIGNLQPIGTALGGFCTGVLLFIAGFHAVPLDFSKALKYLMGP